MTMLAWVAVLLTGVAAGGLAWLIISSFAQGASSASDT